MTVGVAIAVRPEHGPATVLISADGRLTSSGDTLTDAAVKTYDLGGQAAMVAAGSVLPAVLSADMTRCLVEIHNRAGDSPMTFVDIARMAAFFARRVARDTTMSSRFVVAGLRVPHRAPALADIHVSPTRNIIAFHEPEPGGHFALAVGESSAAKRVVRAIRAAREAKKPIVPAAISLIHYMARHEGAFRVIGGGISVGLCDQNDARFSWPIVEIDGRRFFRGLDVTQMWRDNWPPPVRIDYDEQWCSMLDQAVEEEGAESREPDAIPADGIDTIKDADLFKGHFDPERFDRPSPATPALSTSR